MGILKRIREIIEGGIHEQLDKADNPETRISQILRDLEAGLVELRQTLANAMANHHISCQNRDGLRKEALEWDDHAARALKAGDEPLARKALEKKIWYKGRIQAAVEQVAEDAELVEQLRKDMIRVEERFHEVRARKETIVARNRSASARGRVLDTTDKLEGGLPGLGQVDDAMRRMDDLERNIDHKQAEHAARVQLATEGLRDDVEREVRKLKAKEDLDAEMASLKARIAGGAAAQGGPTADDR